MSILRNPLKSDYSKIPNALISDTRLSPGAFRVACYLFSKTDGWEINNNDVKKSLDIKQNSTLAGYWKELLDCGWITRERVKDENGAVAGGYNYSLVLVENHNTKKPTLGKNHNTINKTDLVSKTEIEQPPTPIGEPKSNSGGKDAAGEDTPPVPHAPPSWAKILATRGKFELPATLTPSPDGNDWERRFFVFEAFRSKYPGSKGGGIKELNNLIKSCKNSKSDIDSVLGKMLYAVLYQLKCKEHKDTAEEFFPHWKNLSTWLNQSCWEDEMAEWKGKAAWFNTMCPDSTKTEVERLKSILPCK